MSLFNRITKKCQNICHCLQWGRLLTIMRRWHVEAEEKEEDKERKTMNAFFSGAICAVIMFGLRARAHVCVCVFSDLKPSDAQWTDPKFQCDHA